MRNFGTLLRSDLNFRLVHCSPLFAFISSLLLREASRRSRFEISPTKSDTTIPHS